MGPPGQMGPGVSLGPPNLNGPKPMGPPSQPNGLAPQMNSAVNGHNGRISPNHQASAVGSTTVQSSAPGMLGTPQSGGFQHNSLGAPSSMPSSSVAPSSMSGLPPHSISGSNASLGPPNPIGGMLPRPSIGMPQPPGAVNGPRPGMPPHSVSGIP